MYKYYARVPPIHFTSMCAHWLRWKLRRGQGTDAMRKEGRAYLVSMMSGNFSSAGAGAAETELPARRAAAASTEKTFIVGLKLKVG